MPGPLAGIRVLELARVLAGPWAGQILADLGADVIKVEREGLGDDTRQWGPPFVEGKNGENLGGSYYHSCNRGKRSIALNFESERGRRIAHKLAMRSDILVENFKLGGLKKFGLDYESLSAENPRLIYCSITGFGQTGPYAHRAGYDLIIQGMGGIMSITGEPEREPMRLGVAFADVFTGVYSVVGILAALHKRERTGCGSYVDMALFDTMTSVLANQALSYLVSGEVPTRMGNAHPTVVPYQVFPTSDGHMIIAVGNDGQYAKFCQILGVPELAQDTRYKTNGDRVVNRGTLIPQLTALTAQRTRADLLEKCEAAGVPAGPINTIDEVFRDPQIVARGMQIAPKSDLAKGGAIPGVRTPLVINGRPTESDLAPPDVGQHTQEILREIGEI
ncbi:MAG: CaiB/BaiF CoA-transferase family protein [Pseudorhodoplanes sp.]|jgi:crotonobetainyl-CoA:carnitine CoA-transferase CaiB-like acyl-CoA transferase|nr:CaiB/BaiF CoA-transferase family protein [Pseudorhodoplanes sp.]